MRKPVRDIITELNEDFFSFGLSSIFMIDFTDIRPSTSIIGLPIASKQQVDFFDSLFTFFLNFSQVKVRTGLSSNKIHSFIKSGSFPQQCRRDSRGVFFRRDEVDEWIEKQIASDLAKVQTRAFTQLLAKSLDERGKFEFYLTGHLCFKKRVLHASGASRTLTRADVGLEFERVLITVQQAVASKTAPRMLPRLLCFPVAAESKRGGWIVHFVLKCPHGEDENEFLRIFLDAWRAHSWFTDSWSIEPLMGPDEVLGWVRRCLKDVSICDKTVEFPNVHSLLQH